MNSEMPGDTDSIAVAQAVTQAGSPVPLHREQLHGFALAAALLSGYSSKFTRWGGRGQLLAMCAIGVVATQAALGGISGFIGSGIVLVLIFLVSWNQRVWIGLYSSPRLILLAVPLVGSTLDAFALGCLVVFALAISLEALLRSPYVSPPKEPAANLPGMVRLPSLLYVQRAVFVTSLGLEAALLSLTIGTVEPLLIGSITVCALVATAVAGTSVKFYRRKHHQMVLLKPAALRDLSPLFYVHWDGPDNGLYQVAMWSTYLKRVGRPVAVVVRSDRHVVPMAEATGLPVIHVGDSADVDSSIVPSLNAVVYVNTALKNGHYIRFTELRHIQINHGDSDKPASVSPTFRMYDHNFVAGQAAIDRFAHYGVYMPSDLVTIVGRPQVEDIEVVRDDHVVSTVLYAPTWAGFFGDSDFSSLRVGPELIRRVLDAGKTVIFRPHAFTDRTDDLAFSARIICEMLAEDRELHGRQHVFGSEAQTAMSIVDCFNRSDAMICDISSIVSDYLFSGKPIALVSANTATDTFHQSFPVARTLPVIAQDLGNADDVLADLYGRDTAATARRIAKSYYLGDFESKNYSEHFVSELRRAVSR